MYDNRTSPSTIGYCINNLGITEIMAYSKEVVERFESVLKNPEKHSVGRFDPKDPNVATGMVGAPACGCLLYTSPSPRDVEESRMPSSA